MKLGHLVAYRPAFLKGLLIYVSSMASLGTSGEWSSPAPSAFGCWMLDVIEPDSLRNSRHHFIIVLLTPTL